MHAFFYVLNKEFFETNYPRGKAIEVFRGFILTFGTKTKILYFRFPFLREWQFQRKPRGKASENSFSIKQNKSFWN